MTCTNAAKMVDTLSSLAETSGEPLASLAAEFIPIADAPLADLTGALYRNVRERISVLAEKLAETGSGPTPIIDALVRIDESLASSGATTAPFATRWCALAAERASHAERERWTEKQEALMAKASPIFEVGKNTLYAAPIGSLGGDGRMIFEARVLRKVLSLKPKRVVLVLNTAQSAEPTTADPWKLLIEDLRAQDIHVDVIY